MRNGATPNPTNMDCYRTQIENFESHCGRASDYALKYFKVFAAECESVGYYPEILQKNMDKLAAQCTSPIM